MSLNPARVVTWSDLEANIDIILSIGPYIHFQPVLVYKLLRIMRAYLEDVNSKLIPILMLINKTLCTL